MLRLTGRAGVLVVDALAWFGGLKRNAYTIELKMLKRVQASCKSEVKKFKLPGPESAIWLVKCFAQLDLIARYRNTWPIHETFGGITLKR